MDLDTKNMKYYLFFDYLVRNFEVKYMLKNYIQKKKYVQIIKELENTPTFLRGDKKTGIMLVYSKFIKKIIGTRDK